MRRIKKRYLIPTLVLAALTTLCLVRWHAWFGMPAEPEWTGPTSDYVFPSFEQDKTPESLDLLVLGDIHSRLTTQDYDLLAMRVPNADAVVQLGDWMDRGQNYYYQELLREWTSSMLYGMPVIATPGNHEYSKGLFNKQASVWEHAFPHPANGPVGVPGATYYIDMPGLRLISIDTNPLWRIVHLTRTLTWVHELMRDAGDRRTVVIMHHPVLSAAKGRFNLLIYCTFRHVLGYADLVIAGHDHSYMRHAPFVVLNTAGKTKKQKNKLPAEVCDSVPVYGVLTISHPQSPSPDLLFKVYRMSDASLIDSLYVNHD